MPPDTRRRCDTDDRGRGLADARSAVPRIEGLAGETAVAEIGVVIGLPDDETHLASHGHTLRLLVTAR